MGKDVLRELFDLRNEQNLTFQVMLLRNDSSDQVEIHEEMEVDFPRIQEHLKCGGSVFITSKPSQKIAPPALAKTRTQRRRATKIVTAFYFDHV